MKLKEYINFGLAFFILLLVPFLEVRGDIDPDKVMANPLNISYQFYTDGVSHRTAADPVIEYFNGKYYLFGSHSSGYFSSPDLKKWTYIRSYNLPAVHVWAPAVMVYEGAIYYLGMGERKIYKSTDPENDQWEEIESKLTMDFGDPSFFSDDDGRVYIIWGCSNAAPIKGIEVDPKDGFRIIGNETSLIPPNGKINGWEVPGNNNEITNESGWNEGPCLIKVDGLYYLQYATPGTEYTSYGTGVYVSENPLGPYTCSESNPFAIKPSGFLPGAGHGHSFKDKYGNYWFVGTMIVAVREHFERRVGIFPVYFDNGYMRANTVFSDYPFVLPDEKVNFQTTDISAGMNLLSYGKNVKASSSKTGCDPAKAVDENIKTWWAARTGNSEEWFQVDLGREMNVSSVQMNFADEGFNVFRNDPVPVYKYIVDYSLDENIWNPLIDYSTNDRNYIHELHVLDQPVAARYIRVTNKASLPGSFSIYDLRIFGKAEENIPSKVTGWNVERGSDPRRFHFNWDKQDDPYIGYVIYWGTSIERMDNAVMVYGDEADFGFFSADMGYYFSIQAFNESGKGDKSDPVFIPAPDPIPFILPFDQTDKYSSLGSSVPELDITPLIDNDGSTELSTPFQEDLYFEVTLPDRVKLTAYSITGAKNTDESPKSWILQALSGKRWSDVDIRSNVVFKVNETKVFSLPFNSYSDLQNYTAFRLVIKENQGNNTLSMIEWQLMGSPAVYEKSITSNAGTLTDQYNSMGHEGIRYLIDRKADTKFCVTGTEGSIWIQYISSNPVRLSGYSLTSANDAPARDPKNWTLEASVDGLVWDELDCRSNQDFVSRFNVLEYPITKNKDKLYTHFRIQVKETMGDSTFQLAEWHLFENMQGTNLTEIVSPEYIIKTKKNELVISSRFDQKGHYEIYSMEGKNLIQGKINENDEISECLESGIYFISVQYGNEINTTKVVIL